MSAVFNLGMFYNIQFNNVIVRLKQYIKMDILFSHAHSNACNIIVKIYKSSQNIFIAALKCVKSIIMRNNNNIN